MKPKSIIIPSVAGFVLSFLISIIATHRFGVALLRGFIFALVFAVLSVGIKILSEKLLETGDSLVSDAPSPGVQHQRGGGSVDITIDDEVLTDDGSGPKFNVSLNKVPLGGGSADGGVIHSSAHTQASVAEELPAANKVPAEEVSSDEEKPSVKDIPVPEEKASDPSASADNSGFKPFALGSGTYGTGGGEEKPSAKTKTAKEQAIAERKARQEAELKEIDSLPDLDGLSSVTGSVAGEEIIKDSDFASEGITDSSDSGRVSLVDGEKALSHNAETMAKAIQTLLKKD